MQGMIYSDTVLIPRHEELISNQQRIQIISTLGEGEKWQGKIKGITVQLWRSQQSPLVSCSILTKPNCWVSVSRGTVADAIEWCLGTGRSGRA